MRFFGLLSLSVVCSCANIDPAANDDESSIQGGRADNTDPAIGLVWFEGGGFCSGTLIAPDIVLTAAHCVQPKVAAFYTGPGQPTSQLGPTPVANLHAHAVVAQAGYPGYSQYGGCPSSTFDVGLLKLAKPLTDRTARTLAKSPPKLHSTCRIVGYGRHDSGGVTYVEQRRSAYVTVESVDATSVEVAWKTGDADHGDSGGPLLCNNLVVADTSCGIPQPSGDVAVYYARVDAVRDWIQKTTNGWR